MSVALCPYCRSSIEESDVNRIDCPGCGTPHHRDCFDENGGCTIFGCSSAPPPEVKVTIAGPELDVPATTVLAVPPSLPPPPAGTVAPPQFDWPRSGTGSILFASQPVTRPAPLRTNAFAPPVVGDGKSRTTFIVLGVLLGPFGAHNFYAGYRNKAFAQLLITVLTLGFAGPMSWMWAVIDVCTITEDSKRVKFRN
jgi:hypothetical protein